jgi:ABC-type protease/lipase transport system fused ATPase/permease subunit
MTCLAGRTTKFSSARACLAEHRETIYRGLLARVAHVRRFLDLPNAAILARLLFLLDIALGLLVLASSAVVECLTLRFGGLRILGRVHLQHEANASKKST